MFVDHWLSARSLFFHGKNQFALSDRNFVTCILHAEAVEINARPLANEKRTNAARSRVGKRQESHFETKNESLKARVERKSATISQ